MTPRELIAAWVEAFNKRDVERLVDINHGFDLMHAGTSIRSVVVY